MTMSARGNRLLAGLVKSVIDNDNGPGLVGHLGNCSDIDTVEQRIGWCFKKDNIRRMAIRRATDQGPCHRQIRG